MKFSLLGGFAAMLLPMAVQASPAGGRAVTVSVSAARVYETEWHHRWHRYYTPPPVYYCPPVTVCPPPASYYDAEPEPYFTPEDVPPVVVEPDDGCYGDYWRGHYHRDWDRHEEHGWAHGGEHGWHGGRRR